MGVGEAAPPSRGLDMRLCNTTDGMFTSVVVLLTFAGLASSMIWDTLAGGNIGLKGARSVAVGGCNFTLIVYSVQYSVVHVHTDIYTCSNCLQKMDL